MALELGKEAKLEKSNPSNAPGRTAGEMKRVPLSLPVQKLQVPEIPGYHLHWFRGTGARLQQAERAGFEFVHPSEVQLSDLGLGGDASKAGNTDMGSRVSVVAGDTDEGGQALRLYLMKQKMEYYLEDLALAQKRNDSVADALTAGYRQGTVGGTAPGEQQEDMRTRYVDPKRSRLPDLFRRKK